MVFCQATIDKTHLYCSYRRLEQMRSYILISSVFDVINISPSCMHPSKKPIDEEKREKAKKALFKLQVKPKHMHSTQPKKNYQRNLRQLSPVDVLHTHTQKNTCKGNDKKQPRNTNQATTKQEISRGYNLSKSQEKYTVPLKKIPFSKTLPKTRFPRIQK